MRQSVLGEITVSRRFSYRMRAGRLGRRGLLARYVSRRSFFWAFALSVASLVAFAGYWYQPPGGVLSARPLLEEWESLCYRRPDWVGISEAKWDEFCRPLE